MPESMMLKLSDVQKSAVENYLRTIITSSVAARDSRFDDWTRVENMYHDDPQSSGRELTPKVAPRHFPFLSPRVKAVARAFVDAVERPSSICQALAFIPDTPQENPVASLVADTPPPLIERSDLDTIQRGLHEIFVASNGLQQLEKASIHDCLFGRGILMFRPVDGDGAHLDIRCLRPQNVVVAPEYVESIWDSRLTMAGYQYQIPIRMIAELQQSGYYYETENLPSAYIGGNSQRLSTDVGVSTTTTASSKDLPTVIWDVLIRMPFPDEHGYIDVGDETDPGEWFRVILGGYEYSLLRVEKWDLGYIPLVDISSTQESNMFWPISTKGKTLSPLQDEYSTISSIFAAGVYASVMPPYLVFGGDDSLKDVEFEIGAITPIQSPIQGMPWPVTFNPQGAQAYLEFLEQRGDAVAGVSRAGISQEFQANTTATAAAAYSAQQAQIASSYVQACSIGVERAFQTLFRIVVVHNDWAKRTFAGLVGEEFFTALAKVLTVGTLRMEMTGKSQNSLPQVAIQTAQMLMQMASVPGSSIDYHEAEKLAVSALNIGSANTNLVKSDQQMEAEQNAQVAAATGSNQLAEMGGAPSDGGAA